MSCRQRIAGGSTRRRGAIMAAVMVCLFVVATISGVVVRGWLQQRRLVIRQQYAVQAFWLTESGIQRARLRLNKSPDYRGETLPLTAEMLGTPHSACIEIRVTEEAATPRQRSVEAVAHYPADGDSSVRQARTLVIQLPESGES